MLDFCNINIISNIHISTPSPASKPITTTAATDNPTPSPTPTPAPFPTDNPTPAPTFPFCAEIDHDLCLAIAVLNECYLNGNEFVSDLVEYVDLVIIQHAFGSREVYHKYLG